MTSKPAKRTFIVGCSVCLAILVAGWPAPVHAIDDEIDIEQAALEEEQQYEELPQEDLAQEADTPLPEDDVAEPAQEAAPYNEENEPAEEVPNGQQTPYQTQPVIWYDEQPESLEDVLALLVRGRPRWEYTFEDELVPYGYELVQMQDTYGNPYYTLEELPQEERQPGEIEIFTAEELRAAINEAADGDILVLHNNIDMGVLAKGDANALVPVVSLTGTLTIMADDNGPYTIYRLDTGRHFSIQNAQGLNLVFQNILLATENATDGPKAFNGGIEVHNSQDITITGLRAARNNAQQGGALAVYNSTLTVEDASLTGNSAQAGGGMYVGENAVVTLHTTAVEQNTAEGEAAKGGGVAVAPVARFIAGDGTSITGNAAVGESSYGGGIYLAAGSNATLQGGLSLANNNACIGGGIYANEGAVLDLQGTSSNITLRGNTAEKGGGAICLYSGAVATVVGDVSFDSNTAQTGGAIYTYEYEALTVGASVQFIMNAAAKGYELDDENLLALHGEYIAAAQFTGGFATAYNNHDINYISQAPPAADDVPTRRGQREEETQARLAQGQNSAQAAGLV